MQSCFDVYYEDNTPRSLVVRSLCPRFLTPYSVFTIKTSTPTQSLPSVCRPISYGHWPPFIAYVAYLRIAFLYSLTAPHSARQIIMAQTPFSSEILRDAMSPEDYAAICSDKLGLAGTPLAPASAPAQTTSQDAESRVLATALLIASFVSKLEDVRQQQAALERQQTTVLVRMEMLSALYHHSRTTLTPEQYKAEQERLQNEKYQIEHQICTFRSRQCEIAGRWADQDGTARLQLPPQVNAYSGHGGNGGIAENGVQGANGGYGGNGGQSGYNGQGGYGGQGGYDGQGGHDGYNAYSGYSSQ
jgi:hypothetical protein